MVQWTRWVRHASDQVMRNVHLHSSFPQTPVSLKQLVEFGERPSLGTLTRAALFLREELPIRLAHRAVELEHLPHELGAMPSIQKVKAWYLKSFEELLAYPRLEVEKAMQAEQDTMHIGRKRYYTRINDDHLPSKTEEWNRGFTEVLEGIRRRHDPTLTTMAQGILEYKKASKRAAPVDSSMQSFLDRFFLSRIGIRFLINQHLALQRPPPASDYVGVIATQLNVLDIIHEAVDNATFICDDYYGLMGSTPPVDIVCPPDLSFMYVPSHLHHMLFEILKNSLRAVVEWHGADAKKFPVTRVIVADGKEDITIKISDEGGGIPRSSMPMIYTYMYTTAKTPLLTTDTVDEEDNPKTDYKAPMAGYGYGLPISRLYARYFGGDIRLLSMEGYGTDAYINLCRLSDSEEPLP